MYRIGKEELEAVREVIESGEIFRYGEGSQCTRFEKRFAEKVGAKHCTQTASGTNSITAALIGVGVGPGDEVVVPACTYMATPIGVLAAGAIPIVADINDTITLDPKALEHIIGPQTRAVIPVHMWGLPAEMDSILEIAKKHDLFVVEDACQGVGGAYRGKMLGSMGDAGAFSFNYYKNMTCGEGGAVVTNSDEVADRVGCVIDPCRFYWDGRENTFAGFVYNGARASEFEGAILYAQMDRIETMIETMRKQKRHILEETLGADLRAAPANSLDWECATHILYQFDNAKEADLFAELVGGTVTIKTGRHVYTEWDAILDHRGGPYPALNPYAMEENRKCRMDYAVDMCDASLDILSRTVFVQTHPDFTNKQVRELIAKIQKAGVQSRL